MRPPKGGILPRFPPVSFPCPPSSRPRTEKPFPLAEPKGRPLPSPRPPTGGLRCDGRPPLSRPSGRHPCRAGLQSLHRWGMGKGSNATEGRGAGERHGHSPRPPPSLRGRGSAAAAATAPLPLHSSSGVSLSARPLSLRRRHPCRGSAAVLAAGKGGGVAPLSTPPRPPPPARPLAGDLPMLHAGRCQRSTTPSNVRLGAFVCEFPVVLGAGTCDIDN